MKERTIFAEDNTRLCIRERIPANATDGVLFVHGGTYDSRAVFAIEGPSGESWFDAVEASGRAAYGIDIRGYGNSEQPFDLNKDYDKPLVRASTAAEDVLTAVQHVREKHEFVHLVGFSWGTIVCGTLLDKHSPELASVTLLAPVYRPPYSYEEMLSFLNLPDNIGGYRLVSRADIRERWDRQSDRNPPAAIRGGDDDVDPVFDRFWTAVHRSDQGVNTESIVAPNGVLADVGAGCNGNPVYDASQITTPTLVIRGSLDTTATRSDALGLYDDLGCDKRTYAEIAGGTHMLALELQNNALYKMVEAFQNTAERER